MGRYKDISSEEKLKRFLLNRCKEDGKIPSDYCILNLGDLQDIIDEAISLIAKENDLFRESVISYYCRNKNGSLLFSFCEECPNNANMLRPYYIDGKSVRGISLETGYADSTIRKQIKRDEIKFTEYVMKKNEKIYEWFLVNASSGLYESGEDYVRRLTFPLDML